MKLINLIFIMALSMLFACSKKKFLNAKPDNALVVPATLHDLQALLDNDMVMNGSSNKNIGGPNPALLIEGSDDYYVTDNLYNNCSLYSKNVYIWAEDNTYGGNTSILDWSSPYRAVYYANNALDGLSKVAATNENASQWNNIKGSALFYRAHIFYQLAQAFAPAYDKSTASIAWGIPLKLTSDVNEKITRATVEETYNRIIKDLHDAEPLLPVTPLYKTRPSKPAVFALLSRTYQTMEDYDNALLYADSCLQLYDSLINFNSLDAAESYPIPLFNKEVIFASVVQDIPTELYYSSQAAIDTALYASYAPQDLRKQIFFFKSGTPKRIYFKGSYDGSGYPFMGIATDEIYFIKAECLARKGNVTEAMNVLNTVLETRFKTGSFMPLTATNADDALDKILTERRKELLMRGLRWTDLRRLNQDQRFSKTLTRYIKGQTYTLPPNDLRYTWPIPEEVINLNPGMLQNPR
jgi:hypothetical protein